MPESSPDSKTMRLRSAQQIQHSAAKVPESKGPDNSDSLHIGQTTENILKEQIKKHEKYDLIILFDDMKPSGIEVLKSLKEIKGYKTPTVVLLEDNKISIKEHYIKDGFSAYLLLSNINEEVKKLDKYLKG